MTSLSNKPVFWALEAAGISTSNFGSRITDPAWIKHNNKTFKKTNVIQLYRGFSGIIREILVIQIKHNRFKTQPRKLVTMSPIPKEKISVCQITFFDRLQAHEVVLVNALCYGTFYCSNAQFPNVMKLTCIVLLSFFGIMDESILSLASLRLLSRREWQASCIVSLKTGDDWLSTLNLQGPVPETAITSNTRLKFWWVLYFTFPCVAFQSHNKFLSKSEYK